MTEPTDLSVSHKGNGAADDEDRDADVGPEDGGDDLLQGADAGGGEGVEDDQGTPDSQRRQPGAADGDQHPPLRRQPLVLKRPRDVEIAVQRREADVEGRADGGHVGKRQQADAGRGGVVEPGGGAGKVLCAYRPLHRAHQRVRGGQRHHVHVGPGLEGLRGQNSPDDHHVGARDEGAHEVGCQSQPHALGLPLSYRRGVVVSAVAIARGFCGAVHDVAEKHILLSLPTSSSFQLC